MCERLVATLEVGTQVYINKLSLYPCLVQGWMVEDVGLPPTYILSCMSYPEFFKRMTSDTFETCEVADLSETPDPPRT